MPRIIHLYRLCRTVVAVWTWRPPPGVSVYTAVRLYGPAVAVLLHDDRNYLSDDTPWPALSRAEVHARLEALAVMLRWEGEDQERAEEPYGPSEWVSPTVTQAGLHFQASIERTRRQIRERRERERCGGREVIPARDGATKGGA